jgi:hypothetical protein
MKKKRWDGRSEHHLASVGIRRITIPEREELVLVCIFTEEVVEGKGSK